MSDFVWDDLKFFIRVTSEGSVAGAARGERVEHSTVARRISRLEASLNVRLFQSPRSRLGTDRRGEMLRDRVTLVGHQMFDIERFAQSLGPLPAVSP